MSTKLTIIFYIVLCLEAGIVLTLLPWTHPFGLGDWGENYFLLLIVQKTGLDALRDIVASGWVRGAVTGLGLLNITFAVREIVRFPHTMRALNTTSTDHRVAQAFQPTNVQVQSSESHHISHHERGDD